MSKAQKQNLKPITPEDDREFVKDLVNRCGETRPHWFYEDEHGVRIQFVSQHEAGAVWLSFVPQGFAEWARQHGHAIAAGHSGHKNNGESDESCTSDKGTLIATDLWAMAFLGGLPTTLRYLMIEREREASLRVLGELGSDRFQPGVDEYEKESGAERRRLLKHSIEPNWSDMKGYYNTLLPIWKKAKRIHD